MGPYIAVLQVHADIIDDWSLQTVRRLTYLAKKFAFLIWEGGRVLNTQRRPSRAQPMSDEEITRSIDMARKRYTKGVVGVAAWAGLASTWVIGPEEQGRGADRLIPILRHAARERVASMTMRVRTEISAGDAALEAFSSHGVDECEDDGDDQASGKFPDRFPPVEDQLNMAREFRKASVISLTRTITQHTEPTSPHREEQEECSDEEPNSEGEYSPVSLVPQPPLLSRGLIICLPTEDDTRVNPLYKTAAIAIAKEHSDFVAGFSTDESWLDVCRRQRFPSCLDEHQGDGSGDREMEDSPSSGTSEGKKTFVVFSPLEDAHLSGSDLSISVPEEYVSSPQNRSRSHQISSLHQLVERAVAIRNAHSPTNGQDNGILYIPVIPVNA